MHDVFVETSIGFLWTYIVHSRNWYLDVLCVLKQV